MTSDVRTRDVVRDALRTGVHEVTAIWWWFRFSGSCGPAWPCSCCPTRSVARPRWPSPRWPGPKLPWWWTRPLLGIAELVLGMWAVHFWQRPLWTLVTLVGVWAFVHGVNEIFAAFAVCQVGRQAERLIG